MMVSDIYCKMIIRNDTKQYGYYYHAFSNKKRDI